MRFPPHSHLEKSSGRTWLFRSPGSQILEPDMPAPAILCQVLPRFPVTGNAPISLAGYHPARLFPFAGPRSRISRSGKLHPRSLVHVKFHFKLHLSRVFIPEDPWKNNHFFCSFFHFLLDTFFGTISGKSLLLHIVSPQTRSRRVCEHLSLFLTFFSFFLVNTLPGCL